MCRCGGRWGCLPACWGWTPRWAGSRGCGANLLRDLRDVYEFDPDGQVWASSMADLLVYANKAAGAARAAGAEAVDAATLAEIVAWYRGTVTTGIVTNQGKRTRTATDARRLARRFAEHEAMILTLLAKSGGVCGRVGAVRYGW